MKNRLLTVGTLGVLGLALGACAPQVAVRGNIVEEEQIAEVKIGTSTREDVLVALGTPTSTSTFTENAWYYIGQQTEKTAFFWPTVVARKILIVRFNGKGVVEKIDQLDKEAGQEVAVVGRHTPTAGKDLGVLEQILGNVGRFPGANQPNKGAGDL